MFSFFNFPSIFPRGSADPIWPHVRTPMDAQLFFIARRYASAVYMYACCRRVSVTSRYCGLSKRLDKSNWFAAWRLPSTYPTLCYKEIWVSPKIMVLPSLWYFVPNSGLISPRQVDRVVNNTRRRRRRRSSLLTSIRQSTSRGSLLQVGQL